jgi:hypothetical protein
LKELMRPTMRLQPVSETFYVLSFFSPKLFCFTSPEKLKGGT